MTRTARMVMFAIAGGAVAVMLVWGLVVMPAFGGSHHPYRDRAVEAAVAHKTSNVVSSINFDTRGFDTLGEESILMASVMGVAVLLRPAHDEDELPGLTPGRLLDLTTFGGYVMLPITLVIGLDVVAHGHLTPGGGFQGGVVIGTGLHLLYVAGRYEALRRLRPEVPFEWGEAFGAGGFAVLGIAGVIAAGAFLQNVVPLGIFGQLFSGGTVPVLNGLVGIEVASGTMMLLAKFLEQAILIRSPRDGNDS
jgi:multicomponent Na+:H+ antiporter subunit B